MIWYRFHTFKLELNLIKVNFGTLAHALAPSHPDIFTLYGTKTIHPLGCGEYQLGHRNAAFVVTLMLLPAILAPAFGQSVDKVSMFMHDSVPDSFNAQLSKQDQRPPMAFPTKNGLYEIVITWDPVEIKPNQIVRFDIKIIDALTHKSAENVRYDFAVVKDNQPIKELRSFTLDGLATHTVEFPSSGSFTVVVNIVGAGDVIKHQNESVSFDLKVVPEFPIGTVIVMATLVGITIALTKFTILNKNTGKDIPQT